MAAPTYARFQRTALTLLDPAPKLGTHTVDVLNELGYTDEEIAQWIEDGVVKVTMDDNYLPD